MPDERTATPSEQPQETGAADDELNGLRQELETARARADELHRSWQRSAADFANFKRRVDEEKRYTERWLIADLLPILDDFERAWASLPRELRTLSWLEGIYQVNMRLLAVLQQHGLKPIETAGQSFNPLEHEAVMREDDVDSVEQTAVAAELQRGYRLHERVLRAALVKVGRPPATGQEAPAAATEPTADAGPAESAGAG